jgi:hypothetical protein
VTISYVSVPYRRIRFVGEDKPPRFFYSPCYLISEILYPLIYKLRGGETHCYAMQNKS